MEKQTLNITNLNPEAFRKFVGGHTFTVEFYKLPETPEEIKAGRGAYRKLNGRLNVAKYVKGTQPEATAKRRETNEERNQIGVYEMRGTSDRVEEGTPDNELFTAKNYRVIPLSPDRLISLTAEGQILVNEVIKREPFFPTE